MRSSVKFGLISGMFLSGFVAAPVSAQDPEAGDTGGNTGWQQPAQNTGWSQPAQDGERPGDAHPPREPVYTAPAQVAETAPAEEADDHLAVVGHLGAGWFGLQELPFPDAAPEKPSAATIGVRYWFNDFLGLDAAIGFGYSSSSADVEVVVDGSGTTTTTDGPSSGGFLIHGGMPLVLYHQSHYKFLLIPELDLGYGWGDDGGSSNATIYNGFVLAIGAKAGAEIHFGFMGLPQLSLQATLGVGLKYESTFVSDCGHADCDNRTDTTTSRFSFATSQFNEPWDLFKSEIAAIYYF